MLSSAFFACRSLWYTTGLEFRASGLDGSKGAASGGPGGYNYLTRVLSAYIVECRASVIETNATVLQYGLGMYPSYRYLGHFGYGT